MALVSAVLRSAPGLCSVLALLVVGTLGRSSAQAAPDTLVVCPAILRSALTEWKAFRIQQHHEIVVIDSPKTATELDAAVRNAYGNGRLRYVLLIGHVPRPHVTDSRHAVNNCTPTSYIRAKANVKWGSEPLIATDIPFADVDGDDLPDLAIGRIPAATAPQLQAVLGKSIDYEQKAEGGDWKRKLKIASGTGGFGALTDALIETAARQVILQNVPADYFTEHISSAGKAADGRANRSSFPARARQQLNEGSLAWVYLGHGRPTELDHVLTAAGSESILSVRDVPKLHCGGHSPLAVLIACYTGAMDSPRNCLAEELLLAKEGPVAVIAATRVTMPYGNIVLGCELLRACFRDHPEHLGEVLRLAERKTLTNSHDDQLRASLDSIAAGLSPGPVDLDCERHEHVLMYHLFGDPLLRLHYAMPAVPRSADSPAANP
ncbi:MAG: hypothetical protein IT427_15610 [Pirellulales bacterium]|nr:hypothetical protein [Pirellulales bacterium]